MALRNISDRELIEQTIYPELHELGYSRENLRLQSVTNQFSRNKLYMLVGVVEGDSLFAFLVEIIEHKSFYLSNVKDTSILQAYEIENEYIGIVYKNDDASYTFTMSILDFDL